MANVSTATTATALLHTRATGNPPKRPDKPVNWPSFHPHLKKPEARRLLSISLLLLPFVSTPQYAIAGGMFDKYVKRKKLEPLEDYVPAVILTQLQIQDLEKSLEEEQPQYAACRSLLRSGPASSFRTNVRAVAQYASDGGMGKVASDSVDKCLRALEELDSLLLHATRNDPEASVKLMKGQIGTALTALDSLLQTVPSDVLEKGKAIADAYRAPVLDLEQWIWGGKMVEPETKTIAAEDNRRRSHLLLRRQLGTRAWLAVGEVTERQRQRLRGRTAVLMLSRERRLRWGTAVLMLRERRSRG